MFASYLSGFISVFFQLIIFAIFARVVLTWLRVIPSGILFTLFVETTEPILRPIRKYVPPIGGVLDVSPIIAFFLLILLRDLLLSLLVK